MFSVTLRRIQYPVGSAFFYAALLGISAACILRYAVLGRSSQLFAPSVYRGSGRRRSIALTFDDGPSPGTLELAEYLESEGVRATFFVCGANVLKHPTVLESLRRMGHEIGNHTFSHARLAPKLGWRLERRSGREIYAELATTQEIIRMHRGGLPKLFRAPYGMRWFGLRSAQQRLNLLGVMWTAIAHDWEWDTERVVKHLLKRAKPGGILCLHDGRDIRSNPHIAVTIRAVKLLIPQLRERGYEFEVVSELLDHAKPDSRSSTTVSDRLGLFASQH